MFRIEPDGLAVVGDGAVEVALPRVREATVVEGGGNFRIEPDWACERGSAAECAPCFQARSGWQIRVTETGGINCLSAAAGVTLHVEEQPILAALSDLSVWAGRYPVASRKEDYFGKENPHAMLDYGSKHVIMRRFFDRVRADLEAKLPGAASRYDVVVVFRPPGT